MSSTDSGVPEPAGGSEGPAVVARRPLVSVCIPTRDRAAWLVEAVRSALAQEIEELEVLVFDDASSDDTAGRVEALADPRVRYFRHDEPVGVARNRNACLDAARGLYLAWLDDDDAYLSGGLTRQVEVLEREPSVALAHGSIEVIDGEGRPCPPWPAPFGEDTIEPGPDAFAELVLGNYVRAPTAVARASAQRAAGPYPTDLGDRAEDWDAWLRLAL
ncbi:MAG: glycosyltransferase family 2 protein, partial [Gemmatimonadota bacterium]|nr:glycosyltransferase family 2 protein [Gemmatimonadota bacterium]